MTEIEYQEFVRHCPYDAMGDYSMFRKQQTQIHALQRSRGLPFKKNG